MVRLPKRASSLVATCSSTSQLSTRRSRSPHEEPWHAWGLSKFGRCGKGHRGSVRGALSALLAPVAIASPGREASGRCLLRPTAVQTGPPSAVLGEGADRIACGRASSWRSCLSLVEPRQDVRAMGLVRFGGFRLYPVYDGAPRVNPFAIGERS